MGNESLHPGGLGLGGSAPFVVERVTMYASDRVHSAQVERLPFDASDLPDIWSIFLGQVANDGRCPNCDESIKGEFLRHEGSARFRLPCLSPPYAKSRRTFDAPTCACSG